MKNTIKEDFTVLLLLLFTFLTSSCSGDDNTDPGMSNTSNNNDPLTDLTDYYVYVTNFDKVTFKSSIKRYDGATGDFIDDFVIDDIIIDERVAIRNPQDILFGPDGHFYVSAFGSKSILKFDGATGDFIEEFTKGYELEAPTKFFFNEGKLYVSQWIGLSVVVFDASTGNFIEEFTKSSINQGMGMTIDQDGNLLIASFQDKRIHKFSTTGEKLDDAITSGLSGPVHLWISNDKVFVQDWQSGSIYTYNPDGSGRETFISGFSNTEGFAFTPEGNIIIADWATGEIKAFDKDGTAKTSLIPPGRVKRPNAITIAKKP